MTGSALLFVLAGVAVSDCTSLPVDPDWTGQGCRGTDTDMVIHGSVFDSRVSWVELPEGGGRVEIIWPVGYGARFAPGLEILAPAGTVVAVEGDHQQAGAGMRSPRTTLQSASRHAKSSVRSVSTSDIQRRCLSGGLSVPQGRCRIDPEPTQGESSFAYRSTQSARKCHVTAGAPASLRRMHRRAGRQGHRGTDQRRVDDRARRTYRRQ